MPERFGFAEANQAAGVSGLWQKLHARASFRRDHGFFRRRLRGLLSLPRPDQYKGGLTDGLHLRLPHPHPAISTDTIGPWRRRQGEAYARGKNVPKSLWQPDLAHAARLRSAEHAPGAAGFYHGFLCGPATHLSRRRHWLDVGFGTVNDLAMSGARPLHLGAGFILEEGLPMEMLWQIVCSMRSAAERCGVQIVTGDTKVVDKGKGDGLFINTAGIGVIEHSLVISPASVRAGDAILVSGDLGRHGMAIMRVRKSLGFEAAME